ncbi:MAG: molybdopterin molybdenumtransferase MoeA, partial [Acidobacteriota bacterium]
MLTPEQAWQRIEAADLTPLPVVESPAARALGCRLAAPLVATTDVPAADVSAMDGYVCGPPRAEDADGDGLTRPLAGGALAEIAAGCAPEMPLPAGRAAPIMTGAVL